MMAKPMKTLKLHYLMIQVLEIAVITGFSSLIYKQGERVHFELTQSLHLHTFLNKRIFAHL